MDQLNEKKVVLGMSGGVDSTAAALLLLKDGYDVIGLFLDVTGTAAQEREAAQKAAEVMGIPLLVKDVSQLFAHAVIDHFCEEYLNGRTPSPCIQCNPLVKFRTLLAAADELGAYYIATGHYAQVAREGCQAFLMTAACAEKDQSYMLYRLRPEVLRRTLFPLAQVTSKEEIRRMAADAGLENAQKKDSQEICFLPQGEAHTDYIARYCGLSVPQGNFIDPQGRVLGQHRGITAYTIGQRKGLGIALGHPVFVSKIDPVLNEVMLDTEEKLFTRTAVSVDNVLNMSGTDMDKLFACGGVMQVRAKIRYAAKPAEAALLFGTAEQLKIQCHFKDAQRAISPGQSIVYYIGDRVLGGGIIQ